MSVLLGDAALKLLPHWDTQSTEHCLCDYMQQWERGKQLPSRPRRSDAELHFFFRSSAVRLGLSQDDEAPARNDILTSETSKVPYSDKELLVLMRRAAPASVGGGWSPQLVHGVMRHIKAGSLM